MKCQNIVRNVSLLLQVSGIFALPLASQLPSLLDATLDDLRAGLDARAFTSEELVRAYIARINETNNQLHAVLQLNPDAIDIARQLDIEHSTGRSRGPLHGIPILVKDVFATADLMDTTGGSYALLGARVASDSTVIAKLREAGAIILGKTNMSEWSSSRSSISILPLGWSPRGGQTLGAYFPGQCPLGSSSGSAVATSIGLSWASLGLETTSSITTPAHINNCVGLKPTVGLVSRHLVIPMSSHKDTVGPITRTVKDAAYMLSAIAGRDDDDAITRHMPFDTLPNYLAACRVDGLRGKRIGVPGNMDKYMFKEATTDASLDAFWASLDVLRGAGAEVVANVTIVEMEQGKYRQLPFGVFMPDLVSSLSRYLNQLTVNPNNLHSIADLINFTHSSPLENYKGYGTDLWDLALEKYSYGTDSPKFLQDLAAAEESAKIHGIPGALANNSLDAIIMPPTFGAMAASLAGTPVITVPLGKTPADWPVSVEYPSSPMNFSGPGQPFGIAFLGPAWSEFNLVGIAYAFEQASGARMKTKPLIQPRTELIDILRATSSTIDA
ncbi:hypothetical protein CDD82_5756 [Ophiocordyceps australis]|uniref:Amidase domain-containing protein n=1 Tax=Ophiocordyceps australis TaxID=1399860 RepID=A0A2C5ZRM3_9HYPO|nr:hypothetical protein CDD82_5756 [Ophiocordyceps australis]